MGGGDEAKKQQKRMEDEKKRLKQEADRAEAERRRVESENAQAADARKRRAMGRSSLIRNVGGELGVKDELG